MHGMPDMRAADAGRQFAVHEPRSPQRWPAGPGGASHVAINLGNGVIIEAYQSGEPIEVMNESIVEKSEGAPVWLRPH